MYKPVLVRTKADGADDDDPNTTPPDEAEIYALTHQRGFRASLEFTSGNTCDVTIWYRNEVSSRWVETSTLSGVGPDEGFGDIGFDSDVPNARVWVQLTNISGGNPIDIYVQDVG